MFDFLFLKMYLLRDRMVFWYLHITNLKFHLLKKLVNLIKHSFKY